MKITSYYCKAAPEEHFQLWDYGIGIGIPNEIASMNNSVAKRKILTENHYAPLEYSDMAYCQLFALPDSRPAKFIYTFLSDYIGNEKPMREWAQKVKPNLVCCLQHLPEDLQQLVQQCGGKTILSPWFITNKPEWQEKSVTAMCSGCTDPCIYPGRNKIAQYLSQGSFKDVIISCSSNFGKYPLSNKQYSDYIKTVKYYLSGGIYDRFVPPKYYEVANYGACIITFNMEMLSRVGFVHNETCIIIKDLDEIPEILSSDKYLEIGKNAQKMVQSKHHLSNRASEILEVYNVAR
jgi:hypothetical protein